MKPVVIVWVLLGVASTAFGQQTLFNVPSADVLDRGAVYVEGDNLWRPEAPRFAIFTARIVAGLGDGVEGGVNVGGFQTPGRSVPTATLALKWQPLRTSWVALTAGVHGLLFLRGASDGSPALHAWGHAAFSLDSETRFTIGGWVAGHGYAADEATHGVLAGFEGKMAREVTFQMDWFSGGSSLGYFTPGIAWACGPWTLYLGYSVANRDSQKSAALVEVGRTL